MPYIKIKENKIIDWSKEEKEWFHHISRKKLAEYERGDISLEVKWWELMFLNPIVVKTKLDEANEIVDVELRKLRCDSIQDWATTQAKFDILLKKQAWDLKIKLREQAREMQWEFNKKYYWSVFSEEWNKYVQDLLIQQYV